MSSGAAGSKFLTESRTVPHDCGVEVLVIEDEKRFARALAQGLGHGGSR